jgi:hypothetical protein
MLNSFERSKDTHPDKIWLLDIRHMCVEMLANDKAVFHTDLRDRQEYIYSEPE